MTSGSKWRQKTVVESGDGGWWVAGGGGGWLFCPSFIKQPKEIERVLPVCPHKHLTELEVNGFYGNQHEVLLLKYLIDNLVELKVLAVSPSQKVYRGFNNWVYEEAMSWYKFRTESICGGGGWQVGGGGGGGGEGWVVVAGGGKEWVIGGGGGGGRWWCKMVTGGG
ncbi:hypothetical protein TEA_015523 [Camellia sinensis var. sinensis]|uniref:FBD domain-containing protein n=1 Tax=Camellia sinensis var. sinensis TaxID=542762 RepID=A0A4S4DYX5_CAMSN|nr:hypothetical protein TEA_015523 [Camellia sinensis var. sinensis]